MGVFEQGYTFTPLGPGDFTGVDGKCLKGNGQEQNNGQILLESGSFSSESKKQECLETCSRFSESIHVTGCEAAPNGCYLHTDEVKFGSNNSGGNRMCYIPNRYQPPDLKEEQGWCVSGQGHSLKTPRKLASGDYGPSEVKKKKLMVVLLFGINLTEDAMLTRMIDFFVEITVIGMHAGFQKLL